MAEGRNRSSSLRRALDVLSSVAAACERDCGPTLSELAACTGINRSTVSRLLQPLIDARLVDHDPETGRYCLGPQTARLGQIYLTNFDVHDVAGPVLRSLVDVSHETAHLGIRDGSYIVYVDKVESPLSVRTVSTIGSRQPLYSTAMGKILLAHCDPSVLACVIESGIPARAINTITEPERLREELERARAQGYAIDDEENEAEIRCVGAAVFNHRAEAIAAISVSGPGTRMTIERITELSALVREAASDISRRLGAPEEVLVRAT